MQRTPAADELTALELDRLQAADDAIQAARYRQLIILAQPVEGRGPLAGRIVDNVLRWAAEETDVAGGRDESALWRVTPEVRPVSRCGFPGRLVNELEAMGVLTLGDLAACTVVQLIDRMNIGPTSIIQIRDVLTKNGLEFKGKLIG